MELGSLYSIESLQSSLSEESGEVCYRENGNRAYSGDEFLNKISGIAKRVGVKRVGDISHLAFNRYPVIQTTRPGIYSHWRFGQNTGSQGKGPSLTQAKISALMESIEGYCAEPRNERLVRASYDQLRKRHKVIRPDVFPICDGKAPPSLSTPIMWVDAFDLKNSKKVKLPAELAYFPFFPRDYNTEAFYPQSTNGLASGGKYSDAIIHAIYELIERHYEYEISNKETAIKYTALYEEEYHRYQEIIANVDEGLELQLLAIEFEDRPNCAIVECKLMDEHCIEIAGGWGCCFHVDMAIERAVSEAFQSLATIYSGSREDIESSEEISRDLQKVLVDRHPEFRTLRIQDYKKQVTNQDFDSLSEELNKQLLFLEQWGFDEVYVVNLSRHGVDLPVVKVLIPGIEFPKSFLKYPGNYTESIRNREKYGF